MTKKKNKLAKRRLLVFGTLSIVAIAYFFTSLITYSSSIKKLENEQKNLNLELEDLKKDSENLRTEIEKLKDPEYIARYAREEYSYSKQDGEYIIKINDKDENIVEETKENNDTYKYIIGGSVLGLLGIIIYIIKK